jgi:acetyl esterase/lipase
MSIQLFLLNPFLRFQIKRRLRRNPEILEMRPMMLAGAKMQKAPPTEIKLEQTEIGGVRSERIVAPGADETRALFYIHGGGWVAGSPAIYRSITWRLAKEIGIPVFAVDYRLAPEHPYPAGLNDCVAAYRGLLDKGINASNIIVGGDSAGGNLTLALALRLRDEGLPLPAALICLSPATDMTSGGASATTNAEADTFFVPEMMATVQPRYFPDDDPKNPYISPLFGDMTGLPPTLFHVGNTEMLLDDSTRMAKKMEAAGIDVTLEVWPKVFHVWHLMADQLPEARKAISGIASFARARLNILSASL